MGIACVQAHHRISLWNTRQPDMFFHPIIRFLWNQRKKADSPDHFPSRIPIYEKPVNTGQIQKAGKSNDRPENPL